MGCTRRSPATSEVRRGLAFRSCNSPRSSLLTRRFAPCPTLALFNSSLRSPPLPPPTPHFNTLGNHSLSHNPHRRSFNIFHVLSDPPSVGHRFDSQQNDDDLPHEHSGLFTVLGNDDDQLEGPCTYTKTTFSRVDRLRLVRWA